MHMLGSTVFSSDRGTPSDVKTSLTVVTLRVRKENLPPGNTLKDAEEKAVYV